VVRWPEPLHYAPEDAAARLSVDREDAYGLGYRLILRSRKSGARTLIDGRSLARYEAELADGSRGPDTVELRQDFRETHDGWVCKVCAC
jgi:hypothetical protein